MASRASASLRSRLNDLVSVFTSNILEVIRGASVEELLAEAPAGGGRAPRAPRAVARPAASAAPAPSSRRRPGRLPRRSADDIAAVVDQIVELVKAHPEGLRAEQIREELSLQAKELPRPLAEAIEAGRLVKSGQKRATTYAAKGSAKSSSAGRVVRRRGGAESKKRGATRAEKAEKAEKVEKAEKKEAPPVDGAAPAS
jgi:hypothetical protein